MTNVAPFASAPRVSQAAISKAIDKICPTRSPGRIPKSPGAVSKMLQRFLWVTWTPLGVPVVPEVNKRMAISSGVTGLGGNELGMHCSAIMSSTLKQTCPSSTGMASCSAASVNTTLAFVTVEIWRSILSVATPTCCGT